MGGYASKPPQIDLSAYTGQPYPYAMMKLYDQGIRVFLVALKAGEDYHPSSEHSGVKAGKDYHPSSELDTKDAVIIYYDAETANIIKCIST
jgi:hypothetical protein